MKKKKNLLFRINGKQELASFLLTNSIGGYVLLGKPNLSKYQGLSVNLGFKQYLTLSDLVPIEYSSEMDIEYNIQSGKRIREGLTESFYMPPYLNSLVYSLNKPASIRVDMDTRIAYDNRKFGYYYHIFTLNDVIVVKCEKYTNKTEDSTNGIEEFCIYLVIKSDTTNYQAINKWSRREYEYEKIRNDLYERYVYEALIIKTKKLAIGVSDDLYEAILNAEKAYSLEKQTLKSIPPPPKITSNLTKSYYASAYAVLNAYNRVSKFKGLYAGLPYFFQFWTRDSAISAKALYLVDKQKAIDVLFSNLKPNKDGRLPNRLPPSSLGSADGTGWTFFRLGEMFHELPKELKKELSATLVDSIKLIENNYLIDNLIYSNPNETWMDTSPETDGRKGFCIEIQALHMAMLNLASQIAINSRTNFKKKLNKMIETVRKKMFDGKMLADRLGDFSIRPNIFIAYYVYPELLTKKEWEIVFNNALEELWLEWGGLATISKYSSLFHKQYTGTNNLSYHHGDSWFFINCLAAICMHRLNPKYYKEYIEKIIMACNKELHQATLGHICEVSSASEQKTRGCLSQTWSNALFIELIHEISK